MMNKVLKWLFLLCVASLLLNVLLFWGSEKRELLINIYGAAGLGVLSAVWLLFARKKR